MSDTAELTDFHQTKTTPQAKHALEDVVTLLRRTGLRWGKRPVSASAVASASWLWMKDLPEELLVDVFRHYIVRLEAVATGQPDPGGLPGGMPSGKPKAAGVTVKPKPAGRAKRKGD